MNEYEGYVVVVLSGLSANVANQPVFGLKVYGPYDTPREAEENVGFIRNLEGGAVMIRPMVSVGDTLRRLSAD